MAREITASLRLEQDEARDAVGPPRWSGRLPDRESQSPCEPVPGLGALAASFRLLVTGPTVRKRGFDSVLKNLKSGIRSKDTIRVLGDPAKPV